jgi:hypothetical protein
MGQTGVLVISCQAAAVRLRHLAPLLHGLLVGKDPLNLIVEIKGCRGEDAKEKANTIRTCWVPGVNNLGKFGRWAIAEFCSVFNIDSDFDKLIDSFSSK